MAASLKRLFPDAKIALHYKTDWELLVAVELSAQCTDIMVNKVTEKLFKKYKTLNDYVRASQSERGIRAFEEDIRQTGFYRNKTKNILAAARMMEEKYNGLVPKTMEEMLAIPGVARKTANVVLKEWHGIVLGIAVDTHVRRFVTRFALSDYLDPTRIERDLMQILPRKEWGMFTHRLIHYGREVCPALRHECRDHPLTKLYPPAALRWPKSH